MRTRAATKISPTGVERTFEERELIVSKTDRKGVITYANETFLTISRYSLDEVVGQPHNVIRHPRMPRGLFSLLWGSITTGEEVFAYIDNLAADGANYWVLAHVTASYNQAGQIIGFHSNRRKPERRHIDAIRPLYDRMLQAEERQGSAIEAARAGLAVLLGHLDDAGATYDQFIWGLISDSNRSGLT